MLENHRPSWMTEEHELLATTARRFTEEEIVPNDERWRKQHRVDKVRDGGGSYHDRCSNYVCAAMDCLIQRWIETIPRIEPYRMVYEQSARPARARPAFRRQQREHQVVRAGKPFQLVQYEHLVYRFERDVARDA